MFNALVLSVASWKFLCMLRVRTCLGFHKINSCWSVSLYVKIWCLSICNTKCSKKNNVFYEGKNNFISFIFRAFRGKHITLVVRFPNQGRQVEDLDIWSHTNDTIGQVRRCILNRIKANSAHTKVELFIGGELVDPADDRKLIGQLNLKDKTVSVAVIYVNWGVTSLL